MALKLAVHHDDVDKKEFISTLIHDFEFTCTSQWNGKPDVLVYSANRDGIILQKTIKDTGLDSIHNIMPLFSDLVGPVMISGGHTTINMGSLLDVSDNVGRSTFLSLEILKLLRLDFGLKTEFMIQVNDLYMNNSGNAIGSSVQNKFRKKALNPYVLPCQISELIKDYSNIVGEDIQVYYCAEKNMADRFKRHADAKRKKDKNTYLYYSEGKNYNVWSVKINSGDIVPYMKNSKPNCVAANAAMLRSIRYKVSSTKIRNNYRSYIGVFPLCSIDNVLDGYRVAHKVYGLTMPTYYVFVGKGCA